MRFKKFAAIVLAALALALAAAFGLFPFFEHKINWDYVAAKAALSAADAECLNLAEKISSEVKYKPFLSGANAHIALQKLRNEGEFSANSFIKNCGKNFDFEEYLSKRLASEISREPDFAAGLLKIKYESQINSLKNPLLKAVLLYNMSLKAKPKDARVFAKEAFGILKEQPKTEELAAACVEISKLAIKAERPEDFFEALRSCPRGPHYYDALFQSLKNKKFRDYIYKNNRYDWSFYALETRQEMLSKKPKPPLEIGKKFRYALHQSDFNGLTQNYVLFNLPLVADIAFICQKEDLLNEYKKICASAETLKSMQGSRFGYLKNAAVFFTAANDINLALKLAGLADGRRQKLRILNSIAFQMPAEKACVEKFIEALNSAR